MGLFWSSSDAAVYARLGQIERKLDALLESLEIKPPGDGMGDIRELVKAGKMIEAIKAYRERTGMGLAEAKAAVERGL